MNRSSKNEYKCNEVVHHTLHDVLFKRINNQKNCPWARAARDRLRLIHTGAQLLIEMDGFANAHVLQYGLNSFVTSFLPRARYAGTFEALSQYCPLLPEWENMAVAHQGHNKLLGEVAIDAFLVLAICCANVILAVLLDDRERIVSLNRFEQFILDELKGVEFSQRRGIEPVLSMTTLAAQFRDLFDVNAWIQVANEILARYNPDRILAELENKGVERARFQASIPEEPMPQRPMSSNSGGRTALNDPMMPGAMDMSAQSRQQQRKPTAKPKKAGAPKKKAVSVKKKPAKKASVAKRKPHH